MKNMNSFPLYNNPNNQEHISNSTADVKVSPNSSIKENMSTREIANIMSDRLMSYVDKAIKAQTKKIKR